ncbi:MAG: PaREP1 family protein [Chloroflexota bacterium]|nr:PaREP1 family protein [Chloroflexota bacterium]MDE2895545.1 PaREP1 family protein [Chloroflexota bacterium]
MVTAAVGRYSDLSSSYLRKAHEHLAEGDLVQASEKGWGAAAELVKACAEARDLDHVRHRQLWLTVNRLVDETGDRELQFLFSQAESLHGNFYEDYYDESAVASYLGQVVLLLDKLRPLIEPSADA